MVFASLRKCLTSEDISKQIHLYIKTFGLSLNIVAAQMSITEISGSIVSGFLPSPDRICLPKESVPALTPANFSRDAVRRWD